VFNSLDIWPKDKEIRIPQNHNKNFTGITAQIKDTRKIVNVPLKLNIIQNNSKITMAILTLVKQVIMTKSLLDQI